jgi:hypothetical protein
VSFPPAPDATTRRGDPEEASLRGDLEHVTPTDVLQLLGYLGLSGRLQFSRGEGDEEEDVTFLVQRGRLVEARGSGQQLRLGELLVRRYEVALEAVLDHLRYQRQERERTGSSSRIGERLLAAGYVRPEVLQRALDDAASRMALGVLTWSEGRFAYWSYEVAPPAEVSPDVGLEELVLERWGTDESGEPA